MSAVAEEKFGSSSVQRSNVPAGTRISWALVLACTPRNNTEIPKYAEIRRMCYLPVRRPGRTCSKRQCEDEDRRTSKVSALPGPTLCFLRKISSRSMMKNYSCDRKEFNRQYLLTCIG